MNRPNKLLNRNFFLLWQGQFVSLLGSQMVLIALVFWVKHATGSATAIGLLQMVSSLPIVILGPISGTFADRYSRRTIIVLSDVLRGIAVLSLAGVTFLAPEATGLVLVWLTGVLIFTGVITAFFNPAVSAAIPDLVPENKIASANSLSHFAFQLTVFIGQGLGGTLFRLLGAAMLFLIDGLSYLFSAVSESFITIPQTMPDKASRWQDQLDEFKRDTAEGFRYVWNTAGLRELIFISALLTFFTVPVVILLPFYVEDFLKAEPDWYGFLLAAFGVGSMVGYVVAGAIKLSGTARSRWMMIFIVLQAAGYGVLGLITKPIPAVGLAFVGGITGGFVTVHITTILQITTPGEIRGRVFGLLATISGSLAPIAMGLAGIVADLVNQNIPLIYIVCGAMQVVLSLVIFASRHVREYLAYERDEEPSQLLEKQPVTLN